MFKLSLMHNSGSKKKGDKNGGFAGGQALKRERERERARVEEECRRRKKGSNRWSKVNKKREVGTQTSKYKKNIYIYI